VLEIPARSRNLFRFRSISAPSLHECDGKEGNGVLRQRLELVVNRLRIVALLEIGYVGGEGCKFSLNLLFSLEFSGDLFRLDINYALPGVDLDGKKVDAFTLVLDQFVAGIEFTFNRLDLLGLRLALSGSRQQRCLSEASCSLCV
jgi:hypothetical protein